MRLAHHLPLPASHMIKDIIMRDLALIIVSTADAKSVSRRKESSRGGRGSVLTPVRSRSVAFDYSHVWRFAGSRCVRKVQAGRDAV